VAFTPKTWQNHPSTATPITAAELNRIEQGVAEAATAADVTALAGEVAGKAPASHAHPMSQVSDMSTLGRALGAAAAPATARQLLELDDQYARKPQMTVPLSRFSGTDDEKLTAAIAFTYAVTNFRGSVIHLDEQRDYTFTQQQDINTGFCLQGPGRPQDQPRSSRPIGNRVLLRMTGGPKGWLRQVAGNVYGIALLNLSIDGDNQSAVFEGNESGVTGVCWTASFRDVSVQNALGVFGTKANKFRVTACEVSGYWNVNNVRERAFQLGGSDFFFSPSVFLLDSPPELLPATEYLGHLSNLSNTWIRSIYCTAEGHSALLLSGGASDESVWIKDTVFEGRNAGQPCPGALIRVTGGQYAIRDCRFAFAMTDPAATGRNDSGVIHQSGGNVWVDGCTYRRATGVGEEVPFLYVSGGKTRVTNIIAQGSWTGKPIVKQAQEGLVEHHDDTVTLITAMVAQAHSAAGDTSSGSAATGTGVTVTKPTNLADGDLIVIGTWTRAGSTPYTGTPAGMTRIDPSADNTSVGVFRVYIKHVTSAASEPASYAFTGGGSGRHAAVAFRVTGHAVADTLDVAGAVATLIGSPDRVIMPGVTTTQDNTLLIGIAGGNTSGGLGSPLFTNVDMVEIASAGTATGAAESGVTMFAQPIPATGATSTRPAVADRATGSGAGYMLAIRSAG